MPSETGDSGDHQSSRLKDVLLKVSVGCVVFVSLVIGGAVIADAADAFEGEPDKFLRVTEHGPEGQLVASNISNGTADVTVQVNAWNHYEVLMVKLTGQEGHKHNGEIVYLTEEDTPYTFKDIRVVKQTDGGSNPEFSFDIPVADGDGSTVLAFDAVGGGDFAEFETFHNTVYEENGGKIVHGPESEWEDGGPDENETRTIIEEDSK